MRALFKLIAWDLRLLIRYNILMIAIIIAVAYTSVFLLFGLDGNYKILVALILSDPTFMGFIFVGVMVLFEKGSNTLQALVVTPLKIWQYLFSRAISLTLAASVICFSMAFAGYGFRFNYFMFFIATLFSSVFFVFLGFIGVVRVKTFNQYIILLPVFLAPLMLPYLNYFGVTETYWFYLIPTQAALTLYEGAFNKVPAGEMIYALVYLSVSIGIAFVVSKRLFLKHIIRGE